MPRADDGDGPFYRGASSRWLAELRGRRHPARRVLRAARSGTLSVLYVDYRELTAKGKARLWSMPMQPILPPFNPEGPAARSRRRSCTS
jgi:hypothetical protein